MNTSEAGGRRGAAAGYWWPALDLVEEGAMVRNAEGRYLYANPGMTKLLGRGPEELIGRHVSDLVVEDQLGTYEEGRRQLEQTGTASLISAMRHHDGSQVDLQIGVRRLPDDTYVAVMHELQGGRAVQAVKRRQRAGLELWSGDRHRASIDWSLEPIAIVNADLVVLYANEALSALLDRPRVALAGRAFDEFLVSEERTPWRESMAHLATAGVFRRHARVLGRGGERIPVEVTGTVLGNHTFQLVVRDMSTWHEALREALESRAG